MVTQQRCFFVGFKALVCYKSQGHRTLTTMNTFYFTPWKNLHQKSSINLRISVVLALEASFEMSLVIDNGGGNIKAGLDGFQQPLTIANMTAKVSKSMQYLVSDQIYDCRNGSSLNFIRPCDRGYLNNWQCEIDVWNYLLALPALQGIAIADTTLVLTEPPVNPPTLQNDTNEVVFEYFGFNEYIRKPAAWYSMYEFCNNRDWNREKLHSCIIVDSGFSFTHATPFVDQTCQKHAVRRMNIGGKLLTNYLKELVSYRQWNMMDEYLLMNQVKEALCYISPDFMSELQAARVTTRGAKAPPSRTVLDVAGGKLKKQFVLPDFHDVMKGYVKPDDEPQDPKEQVLAMETERFCVPELLFNPSDIGIDQAGVAETTWQSLQELNDVDKGLAVSSVILTGGNAKIPGYYERFVQEFRPLVPDMYKVNVHIPAQPDCYAWQGAARFSRDGKLVLGLRNGFVTKAQYLEYGHHYCNEKFANSW